MRWKGLRRIMAACVALFVLASAGCGQEALSRSAEARYAEGVAFLAAGEADDAREAFREALDLDPDHLPSRLELARLSDARGDWHGAVEGYQEVARLDPGHLEARLRLAHLMAQAQDFAAAERNAEEARALAPEDAEVHAAFAALHEARGDAEAASRSADRALTRDANNRTARLVKARLAAEAGDLDEAIERLDAILAENPADREINLLKAELLKAPGREAALREHLTRMAALYADSWIKKWLAWLREEAGDHEGAYEMLEALAKAAPADVQAALDVVELVRRTQGIEAALGEFEIRIAAAAAGAKLPLRLALANFEETEGRPDAAAETLAAVIQDAPDTEAADTARLRFARARLEAGDREEARRLIETVLERDPQRPDALGLRGALLLEEGRAADAIGDLRTALQAAPEDPWLLLELARAYESAAHPELARDRYAAAAEASGFAPSVVTAYADFLTGRGETDAVVALLQTAARRRPEDPVIRERLEAAQAAAD